MNVEKIQQHYYMRSKSGYTTVAKSLGLTDFILEKIKSFSIYDKPKTTANKEEFPKAFIGVPLLDGGLMLGQSNHLFDGSRDTLFSHQYVIPKGAISSYLENPSKIFQVSSFQTNYDPELGMNLPELNDIPAENQEIHLKSLLSTLRIDKEQFRQLLLSLMETVNSDRKKVMVVLDEPVQELTEYPRMLLEALFCGLPLSYREKVGFLTYTNDSRKMRLSEINITFFERETLKKELQQSNDFVFDFEKGSFRNLEELQIKSKFLDFVIDSLYDSKNLQDFFLFIHRIQQNQPEEMKWQLQTYDELTELYLAQSGPAVGSESYDSVDIYQKIEHHLNDKNIEEFYHTLVHAITTDIRKVLNQKEHLPEINRNYLIDFYNVLENRFEEGLKEQIILAIVLGMHKSGNMRYIEDTYNRLLDNQNLLTKLVEMIIKKLQNGICAEPLFFNYLKYKLDSKRTPDEFLAELLFWLRKLSILLGEQGECYDSLPYRNFIERYLIIKLCSFVEHSSDFVQTAKAIYSVKSELQQDRELNRQYFSLFAFDIFPEVLKKTVSLVDLHSLQKDQFEKISSFLWGSSVEPDDFREVQGENKEKVDFLKVLNRIDRNEPFDFRNPKLFFIQHFKSHMRAKLFQDLIKDFTEKPVKRSDFQKILVSFCRIDRFYRKDPLHDSYGDDSLSTRRNSASFEGEHSSSNSTGMGMVTTGPADLSELRSPLSDSQKPTKLNYEESSARKLESNQEQILGGNLRPRQGYGQENPSSLMNQNHRNLDDRHYQTGFSNDKTLGNEAIGHTYDFFEAMVYIQRNSQPEASSKKQDNQMVYEFIKWACTEDQIAIQAKTKGIMRPEFKRALERYFTEMDRNALKNNKTMKFFTQLEISGLTKVLKMIKRNNANLLMKKIYQLTGSRMK